MLRRNRSGREIDFMTLEELTARALSRAARLPAIEYDVRWFTWGQMRTVAERVWNILEAAGTPVGAPVAVVPRNRPSAVAACLR